MQDPSHSPVLSNVYICSLDSYPRFLYFFAFFAFVLSFFRAFVLSCVLLAASTASDFRSFAFNSTNKKALYASFSVFPLFHVHPSLSLLPLFPRVAVCRSDADV